MREGGKGEGRREEGHQSPDNERGLHSKMKRSIRWDWVHSGDHQTYPTTRHSEKGFSVPKK